MLTIPKRMVKRWCMVDGQPGYLLTNGLKVKQSSIKFEDNACPGCRKQPADKRHEAYIKRFGLCLDCHSRKLFPLDDGKRGKYYLTMCCTRTVGVQMCYYEVDYMLRTCVRVLI